MLCLENLWLTHACILASQAGLRLLTLNEIKSGSAGGMGAPPTFSPTAGMPMQMMGVPMAGVPMTGVPMTGVPMAGMPMMVQGANFGQPGMMPTGAEARLNGPRTSHSARFLLL